MLLTLIDDFKSATNDKKRIEVAKLLIKCLEDMPLIAFFTPNEHHMMNHAIIMIRGQLIGLLEEFNMKLSSESIYNSVTTTRSVTATLPCFESEEDSQIREIMEEEDGVKLSVARYAKLLKSVGVDVRRKICS